MDELMQTAGRYIGRFWTDIAGAGESEEVADVARALVFTPLKALGKRARDAMLDISSPARPGPAAVGERRTVRAARRAPATGGGANGRAMSRFAAEAADAERASTAAEATNDAQPSPSASAERLKRRRLADEEGEAQPSLAPAPAPAARTAGDGKPPAGILKENGRPTKRKRDGGGDGGGGGRGPSPATRHHVTFEDEIANDDHDENRARGARDDSPPRARRRVDIPAAVPGDIPGDASRAVATRKPRVPLAVVLPDPPALPRCAGRVRLRPTARRPASASHHLRASRGGWCASSNPALGGRSQLASFTAGAGGVLASVARPRAMDWRSVGDVATRFKPAELTDLPADPKPLTAGANPSVGVAVPPPAFTAQGGGAGGFALGGGGPPAATTAGSKRGKSKRGKGGDDDGGLFAGLADFKRTERADDTRAGGDAAKGTGDDTPAGGDGDTKNPAAAAAPAITFSFGAAPATASADDAKRDEKGANEKGNDAAPVAAFTFGAPSAGEGKDEAVDGEKKKSDVFTFGASTSATPSSTPAFTFGAAATAATAGASGSSAAASAPASTAPAFTFGSASTSTAAPSFSFGAATGGALNPNPNPNPAAPGAAFTFGSSAPAAASAAASAAGAGASVAFTFGAPAGAAAGGSGVLSTGGAVPAPSFAFGAAGGAPSPAGGGMAMGAGGAPPAGRRKVRARRPPR